MRQTDEAANRTYFGGCRHNYYSDFIFHGLVEVPVIKGWRKLIEFTGSHEALIRRWISFDGFPTPIKASMPDGPGGRRFLTNVWLRIEVEKWLERRKK